MLSGRRIAFVKNNNAAPSTSRRRTSAISRGRPVEGKCELFCEVECGALAEPLRTRQVPSSANPVWNQRFSLQASGGDALLPGQCRGFGRRDTLCVKILSAAAAGKPLCELGKLSIDLGYVIDKSGYPGTSTKNRMLG